MRRETPDASPFSAFYWRGHWSAAVTLALFDREIKADIPACSFEFPPHVIYNAVGVPDDERNLALLCKRTLEMDVPEMMASFLTERTDQPWEFYLDYSRQLWDEARHAMMGTVALAARGVELAAHAGAPLTGNELRAIDEVLASTTLRS